MDLSVVEIVSILHDPAAPSKDKIDTVEFFLQSVHQSNQSNIKLKFILEWIICTLIRSHDKFNKCGGTVT
jgi:hypothetical protein